MMYGMIAGSIVALGQAVLGGAVLPVAVAKSAHRILRRAPGAGPEAHAIARSLAGSGLLLVLLVNVYFAARAWHMLWRPEFSGLVLASFLIAVAGLWDDIRGLRPWLKLAVQATAATVLTAWGYGLSALPAPGAGGPWLLGPWDIPLTLFAIIILLNALDLLEGMHGAPATYACIVGVFLAFLHLSDGHLAVGLVLLTLIGASVGFALVSTQGRLHLGHTGSQLIALWTASELLRANAQSPSLTVLAMPVVLFGIPIVQLVRFHANRAVYHRVVSEQPHSKAKPSLAWARRPELVILNTWLPKLQRDVSSLRDVDPVLTPQITRVRTVAAGGLIVLGAITAFNVHRANGVWRESDDVSMSVPALIASGNTPRARYVAYLAAARDMEDPDRRYWLARAYLADGRTDAALKTYDELFAMGSRATFHVQGRVDMGDRLVEQGHAAKAVAHYALAEAFGRQPPLDTRAAQAFADAHAWDHALAWGWQWQPGAALRAEDALDLVAALAFRGEWKTILATAQRMRDDAALAADGAFWEGHAAMQLHDRAAAIAAFAAASALGHPDAPYFHVNAAPDLPRGVQISTLLQTHTRSMYRPFALAQALLLVLGDTARVEASSEGPALDALEAMVRESVLSEPQIRMPYPQPDGQPRLAGLTIDDIGFARGEPFLVLFHWTVPGAADDTLRVTRHGPEHLAVAVGNRLLELRRCRNLVPFGSFEQVPYVDGLPPGWPVRYATVPHESIERAFHTEEAHGSTWLRAFSSSHDTAMASSYWTPVRGGGSYVLAARVVSHSAPLVAGWEWLDANERPVGKANAFNQELIGQPQWRAQRQDLPPDAAYVRATLGLFEAEGEAAFDAMIIIPLEFPAPAG